MDYMAAEVKNA